VTTRFQTHAAALLVSFVGFVPASAQTPGSAPALPQGNGAAAPAAQGGTPPSASPSEPVTGYSYDPAGRRDPFISLVRRGNEGARNESGERPAGLGGIAVSELTLRGTMQAREGFVALVQGPDQKTYIVKPGDRLFDGTIRAITSNAMVLMQEVNDPLSLDKQREVRKVLRQGDEVK
jgi:Tfp pilus assembly protein PilP